MTTRSFHFPCWFRCTGCGFDRLVPFSCHGRGFCPSCGGRRMAERAAHLVDHVFPRVPVRQWVLSLPHRLRYRLAWDHDLCRAVVGRTLRAVLGFHRRRARGRVGALLQLRSAPRSVRRADPVRSTPRTVTVMMATVLRDPSHHRPGARGHVLQNVGWRGRST